MESIEDFFNAPCETLLDQCNRDQLLKIAEHYKISVGDKRLKENVRAIVKANLCELNVFAPQLESPFSSNMAGAVSSKDLLSQPSHELVLNFEQQKEMLRLRMQLEKEKEHELSLSRRHIVSDLGAGKRGTNPIWSLPVTW